MIGFMQQYFSTSKLDYTYSAYEGPLPSLFKAPSTIPDFFPTTHEPLPNFRRFILYIELVADAWNGSYNMELFCHRNPEIAPITVPITSLTVIARQKKTKCAACIQRREKGAPTVQGICLLQRDVIIPLMKASGIDFVNDENANDKLCDYIRGSFGAKMELPGAQILAETTNLLSQDDIAHLQALPEDIVPRIRLYSGAAAVPKADSGLEYKPTYFYDWKDHGLLLDEDMWKWRPENWQ